MRLSLVVPVHDGADRLPSSLRQLAGLLSHSSDVEVILVDDGSEPTTGRLLADFARCHPQVMLLTNPTNLGKGAAVTRGMLAGHGQYRVFTDADLAYPLDQLPVISAALERGNDVAVACRVLPESRYLMSPTFFRYLYTRHLLSRAYNALVRGLLLPGILDSQAGLKGFTAAAAELVFRRVTIPRFGFDVEALFVARRHGLRTVQVPVQFRYDSEPSTVRLTRDGWNMLADLASIRWNDLRGRYR